jgi:glyoxylase-like metal-dependent hydrolase (beta-lactamase superfamily II)
MRGIVTVTPAAGGVSIHTYTAPEPGWRVNSHIVELPTQLVIVDAQLTAGYATEVAELAGRLGKPVTRLYISHAHPDHFAGAGVIDAPSYALASVKHLIDASGDVRIERGYRCTPGHENAEPVAARPVDHVVEPGEEVIDGIRFSFEPVADAETTEQLTIGLPDLGALIAQDVVYHHVHLFIAEHAFGSWEQALGALESRPYDTILPGHGLPGDHGIYRLNRAYLAMAQQALAAASGPEDLNQRLETAYPDYGGTAMQGLQNFYLFPASREKGTSP